MIKLYENFFQETFQLSHLQELTSDRVINAVLSDVGNNKNPKSINWKATKRLRNSYQKQHSLLNYPNDFEVYRNEWYGRINSLSDPLISPIDFLEEILKGLKGKIDNNVIEAFIYLWFGQEGLGEFKPEAIKQIVSALKNNQDTKITSDESKMLDFDKLYGRTKDNNRNLKYFDKSTKLK